MGLAEFWGWHGLWNLSQEVSSPLLQTNLPPLTCFQPAQVQCWKLPGNKNKLHFFSPPKPPRRKHCRAQQTFGTARPFSDQSSKDIWPKGEFRLTSGQPFHRWKPLSQLQVPWLLSPPSQGTQPLCHPPGALQCSFQASHPFLQTKMGSSWLNPTATTTAKLFSRSPNILGCEAKSHSGHVHTPETLREISREIFAAKAQEELQHCSGQCRVPFHHTTFSQGCRKRKKKNLKINKSKISDGSSVSELPVPVQPEVSRV